jgi:uncharacterized membrane protein YgcG
MFNYTLSEYQYEVSSGPYTECPIYLDRFEPCMARKFLIVAPACYSISYYPRKRVLRITTSSHGGAGTGTDSGSGTTDSGASSSSGGSSALFRFPPPLLFLVLFPFSEAILCL